MKFAPGPRFYHFINDRFSLFFWPVFVIAVLVAAIQVQDRGYLINTTTPNGIPGLELGKTKAADSAIIQSWRRDSLNLQAGHPCLAPTPVNRLKRARFDVRLDYFFIGLYTALAIIIIAALQTRIKKEATCISSSLLGLAILAGLCDGIENIGLLNFIRDGLSYPGNGPLIGNHFFGPRVTSTCSIIKWSLLIFLAGIYLPFTLLFKDQGLRLLSNYIREKSLQLFRYRVILAGVLIFFLPIWMLDQGQDLLINSNSSDEGVLLFIAVVGIAAFLNWYLAKLFFEKKYCSPLCPVKEPILDDPIQQTAEKKVSRFLGVATIIIPAVAILNARQVINITSWMDFLPPILWLVGLLALFFALIRQDLAGYCYLQMEKKWGTRRSSIIVFLLLLILVLIIPAVIRLLIIRGESNTPDSLIYLFGQLILLALAFYLFVSVRSYIFSTRSWLGGRIGWPILLSACILALLFIGLNIFPLTILALDCNYLSLPVLLAGIVFYILLFTLLIRISLWKKINFVLLIVAAGLIISVSVPNDYHDVKLISQSSRPGPPKLEDYFKGWLLQRRAEIESSDSFPVFLVNTYGGGIRAAAFTNMVFSYLDSCMIANRRDHKGFEHFVFAVSGASGGTVGAALQCAYRAQHLDGSSNAYALDSFQRFYRHDFLTPVLSNMLGADAWSSVSSFHLWRDRSEIQENIWAGFGRQELHLDLGQEFDALWDTSAHNPARYEVPLLFSNTLNIDDGLKGICAPVTLMPDDFPATIFIRSELDAINAVHWKQKESGQSLSLITGAFLSARFPIISPSGKLGGRYNFMDGGCRDNSGASTSEDIFVALARSACRTKSSGPADSVFYSLLKKVRFHFISITNSPYYNPDTRQKVSNHFELISPLVGIVNSGIYGNARIADNTLQYRYSPDTIQFQGVRSDYCSVWITGSCVPDSKGRPYTPILPLGWQISAPSLQRLRQSFDNDKLRLYDPIGIPKILKIVGSGR